MSFFRYSINMSNLWKNEINNELEQIKEEITLLQDNLKQSKKSKIYWKMGKSESQKCKNQEKAKCAKANCKNAKSFANQKETESNLNCKNVEHISKRNRENQTGDKSIAR